MGQDMHYQALTDAQRDQLIRQGCRALDWEDIQVEEGFNPDHIRHAEFSGQIRIGRFDPASPECGIRHARIHQCEIGRDAKIANIGVRLAHYRIGDRVTIEDVGLLETRPGAAFGNGVRIEVLNEAGGREVILFNELSAQFAYLMCLHRHRPGLVKRLETMADNCAAAVRRDQGTIGDDVTVQCVRHMVDVNLGNGARITGASRLVNGTVLSEAEAPTTVGTDVQCEDFIIAEGSGVSGGSMLRKTFVGQGCTIGRQFSAEQSLFFANCEAMHGEAVSIFAGPYTVTHHKSTLLIAGLFSFYNAGSGTNQSNHMYKLGPVHEGKLERGTKTGSFSYVMWPCRVGPFSVILGKHTRHFDTGDLPFSILDATSSGRCALVPGLNLSTVGTLRDGTKWPARDRRTGRVKRDLLSFDIFSPYTVGRMLRGAQTLAQLHATTARHVDTVNIHGADVKRVLLRTGQKSYRRACEMYLLEKVVERAERAAERPNSLPDAFTVADDSVHDEVWLDIAGLLMPRRRLDDLVQAITHGEVNDLAGFAAQMERIGEAYSEDEWGWVRQAYAKVFDRDLEHLTEDRLADLAQSLLDVKSKYLKLVLADAQKEFGDQSRIGFGHDGPEGDMETDFSDVRGTYENNKFVKQVHEELAALQDRVERLTQKLTKV